MSPDYPIIMVQSPSYRVHSTVRKFRTVQTDATRELRSGATCKSFLQVQNQAEPLSGRTVKHNLTVHIANKMIQNKLFGNPEQLKERYAA